ncbi:MAG: gamma-glutamylcyclotransferase family protein [Oscillospiraceae bacterium]
MKKLYIAYGSNISIKQMQQRCPGAEIFGTGVIEGYELNFNHVATITKKQSAQTPALVWSITPEDERMLDVYEGVPHKYHKARIPVTINGETVRALAYVMNESRKYFQPAADYYNRIADGYNDCGLDQSVLEEAYDRSLQYMEKHPQYNPVEQKRKSGISKMVAFDQSERLLQELAPEAFLSGGDKYLLKKYLYDNYTDAKGFCDYARREINDFLSQNAEELVLEPEKILYAAYGSNLNLKQMRQRCPASDKVSVGTIKGYRLAFNGCATIEPEQGAKTPVLLWDIDESDWRGLDAYEGFPVYYRKERVRVAIDGQEKDATVYIMNNADHHHAPPSDVYFHGILQGYKENGLDTDYLFKALRQSGTYRQTTLFTRQKSR